MCLWVSFAVSLIFRFVKFEFSVSVAHGCIYAMVQLFDANGQMVEGGGTLSSGDING